MKKVDFKKELDSYKSKIKNLSSHSNEEIRIAKEQAEMITFSINLGKIDLNLLSLKRDEFLEEITKIENLTFNELKDNVNFESPYNGEDKEEWANYSKISRIKLLIDNFLLVSRLRDDEPEAWDEVNELFYDD